MNITIDASCLMINQYTGLSKVVINLLKYLPLIEKENDYTLFLNYFHNPKIKKKISFPNTINYKIRLPRRLFDLIWHLDILPIDFYIPKTDIYHSLHIQIPPTKKIKTVLTVHDCRYLAYPQLYNKKDVIKYQNQMALSLKRVDQIVTVSNFTRNEIISYFSFPEDRISVINNGFNFFPSSDIYQLQFADDFLLENNIPKSYIIYVGTLDPRKNLKKLIRAYQKCYQNNDYPDMVIVGIFREEWDQFIVKNLYIDRDLQKKIHITGIVDTKILIGLIKNARAFCYPSLYEGFGYPPLEAMSLGVPVLTSDISSIPEIVDNAALLVNPFDISDISRGLNQIIYDDELRENLIKSGYKQIRKYSWKETAKKYLSIYKKVLNS